MTDYIYKANIFFDTSNVVGADNTQEALDTTDFEDNHKSTAIAVSDFIILNNAFMFEKSYTDFDALITGDLDYSDVKFVTTGNAYCLYLVTTSPL